MKLFKPYYMITVIVLAAAIALMAMAVKGDKGNPIYYQTEHDTRATGPYESSNSTARYALTQAIVDNHSFYLNLPQARFASPDVVYYKGRFTSIFTPGVSFVAIPFYIAGKAVHAPQLVTYLSVVVFSLINLFLVAALARVLGAGRYTGYLCGLIFTFASNAYVYALTLTQHQMSTTFILLAILNAAKKRTWKTNFMFGMWVAASALFDIPNLFMLLPVGLYVVYKNFHLKETTDTYVVSLKASVIAIAFGMIPFVGLFGWYNYATNGSFAKLGQTIGRTSYFSTNPKEAAKAAERASEKPHVTVSVPFNSRNLLNGFYILALSDERSWLYYCPVLLMGIVGLWAVYRAGAEKRSLSMLFATVALVDIVMYSMFGDPWGGWAFGPRYLIPAAALMSAAIGPAIHSYYKSSMFTAVMLLLTIYSFVISSIGAFTTAAIPPLQEAMYMLEPIPYTYKYNLDLIDKNTAGSLLYNLFFSQWMTLYSYITLALIIFVVACVIVTLSIPAEYQRRRTDR